MIIAWLLALAIGAAAGYAVAQRIGRKQRQQWLEEQQVMLQAELETAQSQIQVLRQNNADLRYQLGESEKTRRYLEMLRQENNQPEQKRDDTP